MTKENVIFSKKYEHPTMSDVEKELKEEGLDDGKPELMPAEDFLSFIKEHRRIEPIEERLAHKDIFIEAVRELSETYEIDAENFENEDGYTANILLFCASYNGYIKKLITKIFMLSDEFSMLESNDDYYDVLMTFTYHTHRVYIGDREITEF